jgi:GNAT superfamily N-acetyltransferase
VNEEFVDELFVHGTHAVADFDSGELKLDDWLRNSARDSDGRNVTRTYVWHRGDGIVVGYYTLMPWLIERDTLEKKQGRGLPDTIPCFLMARLALHKDLQDERLGTQLLASALARAAAGSTSFGGCFLVVDALHDKASSFYAHHGFQLIPGYERRLVLPTKRIESYLASLGLA